MTDGPEHNAPPPYKRGQSSADELPNIAPCNFVWIKSVPTGQTKVIGRYLIDPSLVVAQDQLEPRAAELKARATELSNFTASVSCDVDIDLWVNGQKETRESNTQRFSYLAGKGPKVGAAVRTTLDVSSSLGRNINVRLHNLGSQSVALSLVCESPSARLELSIPHEYKGKLSITGQPRHLVRSPAVEAQYAPVSSDTTKTEAYIGRRPIGSEIESTIKIEVKTNAAIVLSYVGEVWTQPKLGGDCLIM